MIHTILKKAEKKRSTMMIKKNRRKNHTRIFAFCLKYTVYCNLKLSMIKVRIRFV